VLDFLGNLKRTHFCGALRASDAGRDVVVMGWVHRRRDLGNLLFLDVRDRTGIVQVVFNKETHAEAHAKAEQARSEFVVAVEGKVVKREKANLEIATGEIELVASKLHILNNAKTPPFPIEAEINAAEETRLRYRYLDLRRPKPHANLALRHKIVLEMRKAMDEMGFIEVETPMLTRSTPEGARDYLVPSRVHHGQFYALPQSPQIFKQILMIGGLDRYFQIVKCFRDEDLRADRQPEFTQLDLEMSFVETDDVLRVIEGLTADVFQGCLGITIPLPLPRLRYEDAMLRFGTDKPDMRYGMEIVELTDLAPQTEFKVFQGAVETGGKVRGLNVKGGVEKFSRKGLDELGVFVQRLGAKGLAWIKVESEKLTSPIEKFLPASVQPLLRQRLAAAPGDLLLLVADTEDVVCQALGTLRTHLAATLKLYDPARLDFKIAWILDFPLFTFDAEEKRWAANHHPFTAPRDEDLAKLESNPGSVLAKAYDLVINGYECGGGSIRIHNSEVQSRVFAVLGMTPEQAKQRFGFLLDALGYGAPPHGGIALGLDRWTMMLAGTTNIRDTIAFPKNQRARDLMTGAPAHVDPKQLKELGL
jgi:aspartyl-tRNA synthetase